MTIDGNPGPVFLSRTPERVDFGRFLGTVPEVLKPEAFAALRDSALNLIEQERSFIPAHKKGGTIGFDTLKAKAPAITNLYRSVEMTDLISTITQARVQTTPEHDQSSCSLLFYDRPGDHIGWHYDHNFYRGRHFTVLLPMINVGSEGLSQCRFVARLDGVDTVIETPPNQLLVFEGAKILHRATPIAAGERRIVLSMTYGTNPTTSALREGLRRIKDIAYFGPRALWNAPSRMQ